MNGSATAVNEDEPAKQLGLADQLVEIRGMLIEIRGMLEGPRETRQQYTVEEVADHLGKTPYTVREWCRHGRINATKRPERRGGSELWSISAEELSRYKNEGLLPIDPKRNAGP
jgi:hypothetical protein